MRKVRWTLGVSLVACGCLLAALSSRAVGGDDKGDTKVPKKATKIETKSKAGESALTVDFAKELGLGFPTLTTLGARIEQARQQADPIALALAARELQVAEKVSGKQAAVKADKLTEEAVKMAKQRYNSAELKAVAMLTGEAGTKLAEYAEEAARKEAEKTRGIQRQLHADSRVNATIDVFVDGRYIGTMGPFGDLYRWIGQSPWETTYLRAQSRDGRTWHHAARGPHGNYHWILYP
jgi:hypothetical protein